MGRGAKARAQGSIGGKAEEGRPEGGTVGRREKIAVAAVPDDFGDAGQVRGEDGKSAGHGMDESAGHVEIVGTRAGTHDQADVGCAQRAADVGGAGEPAREGAGVRDAEFGGQPPQAGQFGTVAD